MNFVVRFNPDGLEVQLAIEWQRTWAFLRNLLVLVWSVLSLLAALKASGVQIPLLDW